VLRALERIGDARAREVAGAALREGGDVAIAAIAVLQTLLGSPDASTPALDGLVAVALDASAERRVRLAAFEAMNDLPADLRERLAAALGVETPAGPGGTGSARGATERDALWSDASEGRLPDDPAGLRDAVSQKAPDTPLSTLLRMIDAVRERETAVRPEARRAEWRALRGSLHHALALRGSRVALHDLRETLAGLGAPLPPSFVAAVQVIGDASCLEPLAAAYDRATTASRPGIVAAFKAIVRRERLTSRHTALRRIATSQLVKDL
jgi:hypothetical protein